MANSKVGVQRCDFTKRSKYRPNRTGHATSVGYETYPLAAISAKPHENDDNPLNIIVWH